MEKLATIKDILDSEVFKHILAIEITELRQNRYNRPLPKQGYKYKRDGLDYLLDNSNFNSIYILSHIENIWLKTSNLNKRERDVILYVCNLSLKKAREQNI